MSGKTGIRSETELARAIAAAFDRLPMPDPRRLAAIEARLTETAIARRDRGEVRWLRYAWLAAALAAGAAAAWWAVERYVFDDPVVEERTAPAPITSPVSPLAPRDDESRAAPEQSPAVSPSRRGPVIYQREAGR